MDLIDFVLRFGACGILLLNAVAVFKDARGGWSGRLLGVFLLSAIGYLLCSSSLARAALGGAMVLLHPVCIAAPVLLWLAMQAIFIDEFEPRPWHLALLVLVEIGGLGEIWATEANSVFRALRVGLTIGLFMHVLFVLRRDYDGDLLTNRRKLRRLLMGAILLVASVIVFAELFFKTGGVPAGLETIAAVLIFTLTFSGAVSSLRFASEEIFPGVVPAPLQKRTVTGVVSRESDPVLAKILQAVEEKAVYRSARLSIAALGGAIGEPEYKVRQAINSGLGYRNFNAFLNYYRVREVQAALADPQRTRIPILTLAMDAGYASMPPFNRAFRDITGMAPSEYRRLKLSAVLDNANGPS